jgi:hypothetical protein
MTILVDSECRLCGTLNDLHAHHIVPRSIKRVDHTDNLVVLCARCHRDVHARKLDLSPHLSRKEQAMAVLITGSIEAARKIVTPTAYIGLARHG